MSRYHFKFAGQGFGPEEIEDHLGELGVAQVVVMARLDGTDTVRGWCEHWGNYFGDPPEHIGVDVFDVYEGERHRYTVLYTGWSDSGHVFFANTDREAGLQLWPEGFRVGGDGTADADVDVAALDEAWKRRG
jgi:hypothetical protein